MNCSTADGMNPGSPVPLPCCLQHGRAGWWLLSSLAWGRGNPSSQRASCQAHSWRAAVVHSGLPQGALSDADPSMT